MNALLSTKLEAGAGAFRNMVQRKLLISASMVE
jgi:hypothetical protein